MKQTNSAKWAGVLLHCIRQKGIKGKLRGRRVMFLVFSRCYVLLKSCATKQEEDTVNIKAFPKKPPKNSVFVVNDRWRGTFILFTKAKEEVKANGSIARTQTAVFSV